MLYKCFVDLEKAFDRVPQRLVKRAIKERIQEVLFRAVVILYEEATAKIKVVSGYLDELSNRVGVHQGIGISTAFIFNCDRCG